LGLFAYISVPIIRRLINRFDLQEYPIDPNEAFLLQEVVMPVTQIDELLKQTYTTDVAKDLSAVAGTFVAYNTVPGGKRWKLKHGARSVTTAATRVVVVIGGVQQYLSVAGTTEALVETKDILIDEGDEVGMLTTGNGGDNSRWFWLTYEEEDAWRS